VRIRTLRTQASDEPLHTLDLTIERVAGVAAQSKRDPGIAVGVLRIERGDSGDDDGHRDAQLADHRVQCGADGGAVDR
jgi:hypothetical protein